VSRKIGPYRVLDEIGSGGMGTVYRAQGADGANVALKVIHPHLVTKPGFRERFEREVEAGRRIRAENVVATLDAGEAEADGQPTLFLAMEYVEGQTLRALLEELGRVPEDLCVHIGREVARALVDIHAAGVLHRDVKPENVLITPDSRVKVMDLGVAELADESLRLTASGEFVGSVLYAAPEQFAERSPDGRADLYNTGLLLYELATGEHPFRGDEMAAVIQRQLTEKPRPPAELVPQLSPLFEEVVLHLMEKDREQRFATATDLLDVLELKERSTWWGERARELRVATAGPLRRVRVPRDTPLHGRDTELAQLDALYDRARAGEGGVVLIEGEAGIGKTRLADEFTARLARRGEEFHFLYASYPPGGAATGSGAFSTAYREFFGAEDIEDRLARHVPEGLVPAFAALLLGAPPPAGVAPLSRDAVLHAFTLVTHALAADRPTVVLIEDLHLAPELGRAIFASLAAAVADHAVLLLGTARPGLEPLPHVSRLELRRLTPKELASLLVDLFRSERLAEELGWAIATKSDGNPFFVFELVRALREDQLIAREPDGTWVKTGLIKELHVPSSVLDLVEARIRDLDDTDKDLLEVAACCGFEFDPLLVAAALGLGQIPAMKRLAFLEKQHRLVRAMGRRYVFDHHQVQEALYNGMPELLREPYHARLGAALEERGGDADGARAVELCEHFLLGAVADQARTYLPAALTHLRDGYLYDEAIALAQRALAAEALLEGAERVKVLLQTAVSLETRGRHEEDRAVLEEALGLADGLDDPSLRAKVRAHLGRLSIWMSDYDAARDWLIQARDIARGAGDAAAERKALGNLAIVYYRQREFGEAQEIFRDVVRDAEEREDKRALAIGLLNLGNVHWCLNEYDEARSRYERYRDLSREIGYREGEALAAGNLGNVFIAQGRLAEARAHYAEVIRLSVGIGDLHKVALFESSLGSLDVTLGRPERAREHLERSLELAREIGMPREEAGALWGLAELAESVGDSAERGTWLEQALAIFDSTGERDAAIAVRVDLARLASESGREPDAIRHLDVAIETSRELDESGLLLLALAARAGLPGGDAAQAEAQLEAGLGRLSMRQQMLVLHLLHEATGKPGYLKQARGILRRMREHAPEEDRDEMVENNRLHRTIATSG
jgi:tetratricopeptide (TPR) repeat protein